MTETSERCEYEHRRHGECGKPASGALRARPTSGLPFVRFAYCERHREQLRADLAGLRWDVRPGRALRDPVRS